MEGNALHAAFLRGVNVGRHNRIRNDELAAVFERAGATEVKPFLQSGNVLFRPRESAEATGEAAYGLLAARLDTPAEVIVRSVATLRRRLAESPLRAPREGEQQLVTFMAGEPERAPGLPMECEGGDVELVARVERDVFSRRPPGSGPGVYPNPFVERHFGVRATTRTVSVLERLLALAGD